MAITVALHHKTSYTYERPAELSAQVIRLRPAPHCRTPVLSYALNIWPREHYLNWQQDPHGNYLARVVFPKKVKEFRVEVDVVAELEIYNPFDFFLEPDVETVPFCYRPGEREELAAYLVAPVDVGERFAVLLGEARSATGEGTINYLMGLNQRLHSGVEYLVRMEPGVQTPEETLEKGSGSCRDSAWLLVNLLRGLGYAARFVSGYLAQLVPDEAPLDGPAGAASDFTDLHAWAEVYLPGAGWVGLDATSGLLAAEGHLPLVASPGPGSAAPVTGGVEGGVACEFDVEMTVTRVAEAPRVTKPYSDEAWGRLDALGREVDARLEAGDARLTMGGEPTFVALENPDGEEWNTAAVGVEKRRMSGELLRKLWAKFGEGGMLHHGQGKWYPGESLPRWAFTCYWRGDGEPLWRNPALLADLEVDYGHGLKEAEAFVKTLTGALGVTAEYVIPAFEDVWYYLWKERNLPANVDPLDNRLEDPEERERMAAIFDGALEKPRGWVLPLQLAQAQAAGRWKTGPWALKRERLYLIPGDSAVGLRLPLDTLPWVSAADYPYVVEADPMGIDAGQPLPVSPEAVKRYGELAEQVAQARLDGIEGGVGEDGLPPELRPQEQVLPGKGESAKDVVRTALCVEPREGKLFVFMPPMADAADYFELVAAIEAAAEALDLPVVLEGSRPGHDPRVRNFSVTPDPGVIEVNVQPSSSWGELVGVTEAVYGEARACRLGAEKFMVDGRHCGTGGGNHLVLGGKTPGDSPFLRRPELLASLLGYWQRHASLSYLFSGLFIGPTCQAPRVDEARDDTLYELEIAFAELRGQVSGGKDVPPWLVDRLFRNLLTDVTGNTHRAEFCIDKLFSPDSATGRLGLLELRSFEMPPHARMSLAQQLLLRALVCHFWEKPRVPRKLVRWGTALHDRLLMPHFVWEDLVEVLDYLRDEAGFAFEEEWFRGHFEFRFPLYGKFRYRDVEVELRGALEPWNVLGEEGMAGGAVRFVDSSVERLEVKVNGYFPGRYVLACNGRRVPLVETGTAGEAVGCVRYRAWQPASCLHPTLGVDVPLVFDLIDEWSERAVAGCRYDVSHPGGRSHETFPVNAYEAESRRLARFTEHGWKAGATEGVPAEERNAEFPSLLDLRRKPGI